MFIRSAMFKTFRAELASIIPSLLTCVVSLLSPLSISSFETQSETMVLLSSSTILATKLYDVSVKTTLSCAARCASQATCTYVTIDKTTLMCSLYSTSSSDVVSVAGVSTYMVMSHSSQVGALMKALRNIHKHVLL